MSGAIASSSIGQFVIGVSPIGGAILPTQPTGPIVAGSIPPGISIDFVPSPVAPFSFQATLDGVLYDVVITWNVFGQRWYVNIYAGNNERIVTIPMIGSPPDRDINIVAGYFATSRLVFRVSTQRFEISP